MGDTQQRSIAAFRVSDALSFRRLRGKPGKREQRLVHGGLEGNLTLAKTIRLIDLHGTLIVEAGL